MPRELRVHLRIMRYELACRTCGWFGITDSLERAGYVLDAHRDPVLLAMSSSLNHGPTERWVCPTPRVLR